MKFLIDCVNKLLSSKNDRKTLQYMLASNNQCADNTYSFKVPEN